MSELEDKEKIISSLFEVKGKLFDAKGNTQLTPIVMKIWLGHVREYTADQVLDAVMKYTSKQFAKTLDIADFLTCLPGRMKRLSADEAWALAMQAMNEDDTVVWTNEIARAWGVCREVMPDKVAARMAFRDAYNRISDEGGKPVIEVSRGTDSGLYKSRIESAVASGLLPPTHSAALMLENKSAGEVKKLPHGAVMSAIARIASNNKNNAAKLEEMRDAIRSATPEKAKREYAKLRKAVIA